MMWILLNDLWHLIETLMIWFLTGCMVAPVVYSIYLFDNRGEK